MNVHKTPLARSGIATHITYYVLYFSQTRLYINISLLLFLNSRKRRQKKNRSFRRLPKYYAPNIYDTHVYSLNKIV